MCSVLSRLFSTQGHLAIRTVLVAGWGHLMSLRAGGPQPPPGTPDPGQWSHHHMSPDSCSPEPLLLAAEHTGAAPQLYPATESAQPAAAQTPASSEQSLSLILMLGTSATASRVKSVSPSAVTAKEGNTFICKADIWYTSFVI